MASQSASQDLTEQVLFEKESQSDRLARKSKEMPMFPIAISVCSLAVGYGVYAFKNRGKMSTSVYLMHLRVGAQGAAVATLTLGLIYSIAQKILHPEEMKKQRGY